MGGLSLGVPPTVIFVLWLLPIRVPDWIGWAREVLEAKELVPVVMELSQESESAITEEHCTEYEEHKSVEFTIP